MKQIVRKMIGLGAIAATTILPAALAAQQHNPGSGVRTSPVPRYNLMQLTVQSENISVEEFKTKTQAIRSCYEAKKLAGELDAQTARNRFVTSSQLPNPVQEILRDLPNGHATPVFSADPSIMRVLVICSRV